jgi:hypothetical protein
MNLRELQQKPRHVLATIVFEQAAYIEQLKKELTLERNTNVHLKASIAERT